MQLWTHHPSSFRVDAVSLRVDLTLGEYWNLPQESDFCYREVAPILLRLVGTEQFIWCCTVRGLFKRLDEDHDLMEWEINVKVKNILAFINALIWEDIVHGKERKWDSLILKEVPKEGHPDINALVSVPLPAGCAICRPMQPLRTRKDEEEWQKFVKEQAEFDPEITAQYDFEEKSCQEPNDTQERAEDGTCQK